MARIICGTSGVPFKTPYIPMTLHRREMDHPIFYLPQKRLLGIYSLYIKGQLSDIDSYLLFVALLKSTGDVTFVTPATVTTSTEQIIANNIRQLVSIIWETNSILHPSFKQPKLYIRGDNSNLSNVKTWIATWRENIEIFKSGIDTRSYAKKLKSVEDRLSKLIFSPTSISDISLCNAVANWADMAAEFPVAKKDEWKLLIRRCYNMKAMFSTPKKDIIALKEYCEENIEAGSIHFYNLMKILRAGIANHNDFLGLGVLDIESPKCKDYGYTLLDTPENPEVGEEAMLAIISDAPTEEPEQKDYPTKLSYLKAKLAYRAAINAGITGVTS